LDRREADIAIRLTRPETGDLTAMKIGEMPFRLYANPDWLAQTPESAWGFIGSTGAMATSSQQAALITIAGSRVFGFHSDQVEIQLALACAGGGVALLPDFMAKGRTDLVALTDTMQLTREIWLVVHSDMAASAPVRAVIDCLRGRWE
jgi:DNA-binding transcriptional LysR family regulator